jgi:predicted lactoylglutathione lyase
MAGLLASFGLGFYLRTPVDKLSAADSTLSKISTHPQPTHMKLGAFSISLSVKDLQASKAFYEKLGFTHFAGDTAKKYLIMKNENALIGLFEGMFQGNLLTFNPGWDENAKEVEQFDDIREIQRQLKSKGIQIDGEVDEKTAGPAGFMVTDPDGNIVLIDQHR